MSVVDEVIPPSPTPPDSGDDVHVWPPGGLGCVGLLGWIFGHKYEGRWDERILPGLTKIKNVYVAELEAMKDRTYRGDVCRRCGHVVNERDQQGRGTE